MHSKSAHTHAKTPTAPENNRKSARYTIGGHFPFKVQLTLFPNGKGNKGKDWTTTAVNLSAHGAKVELSLAAVAFPEEPCRLKFKTGGYDLEIPATIAHFRCSAKASECGVAFNFPDEATQKAYRQLLDPVIVGASLVPIGTIQDTPDRHKERYGGEKNSQLMIWREEAGGRITAFDMRIYNFGVRWTEGQAELELYGVGDADPARAAAAILPLTDGQREELQWLFCLSVPNLSESVPLDVRQFLSSLVSS